MTILGSEFKLLSFFVLTEWTVFFFDSLFSSSVIHYFPSKQTIHCLKHEFWLDVLDSVRTWSEIIVLIVFPEMVIINMFRKNGYRRNVLFIKICSSKCFNIFSKWRVLWGITFVCHTCQKRNENSNQNSRCDWDSGEPEIANTEDIIDDWSINWNNKLSNKNLITDWNRNVKNFGWHLGTRILIK